MEIAHVILLLGFSIAGSIIQLPVVGGGAQLATITALIYVFEVPNELAVSCGQVEPLPIVNPVAMLGFKPVAGTGKLKVALPLLVKVTVCGLSMLVEPNAVEAKLRLGASAKSSFTIALFKVSATKTLPLPSAVTPAG